MKYFKNIKKEDKPIILRKVLKLSQTHPGPCTSQQFYLVGGWKGENEGEGDGEGDGEGIIQNISLVMKEELMQLNFYIHFPFQLLISL